MNAKTQSFDVSGTEIEQETIIEFQTATNGYMPGEKFEFTGEFYGLLARFQPTTGRGTNTLEVTPKKLARWEAEGRITIVEEDDTTYVSGLDISIDTPDNTGEESESEAITPEDIEGSSKPENNALTPEDILSDGENDEKTEEKEEKVSRGVSIGL